MKQRYEIQNALILTINRKTGDFYYIKGKPASLNFVFKTNKKFNTKNITSIKIFISKGYFNDYVSQPNNLTHCDVKFILSEIEYSVVLKHLYDFIGDYTFNFLLDEEILNLRLTILANKIYKIINK